jgi:hypothetical protein
MPGRTAVPSGQVPSEKPSGSNRIRGLSAAGCRCGRCDVARYPTAGAELALIDPEGDLVEEVLERVPEAAAERVIVLDPSRIDLPVSSNPLQVSNGQDLWMV